jgi:hypothetical protein
MCWIRYLVVHRPINNVHEGKGGDSSLVRQPRKQIDALYTCSHERFRMPPYSRTAFIKINTTRTSVNTNYVQVRYTKAAFSHIHTNDN